MSTKPRVLVAMSGGVDSSVAAGLLVEQGYDVVGMFMRVGHHTADAEMRPGDSRHQGCCSASDAADARRVAGQLGVPFYALNFSDQFSRLVNYFSDEYASARTPNPCVLCNQWLKFGRLLSYAESVGASLVATGHYARVTWEENTPRLRRAADHRKDQSYVLFGLSTDVLRRVLFPLGEMTKDEVRLHARRLGLDLHDKPESQDICFVPDRDYAAVVRSHRADAFHPGDIRHEDGRLLGRHDGLPNFTIGQRHGLRVAVGLPVYVTRLDPQTNTVTVGSREALFASGLLADRVNWLVSRGDGPVRMLARIRYNHQATPATAYPLPDHLVRVVFDEPQPAVTPGQVVVFYDDDLVLGGGWIERSM
jgi:tRNA-specific 2-thiouridylase